MNIVIAGESPFVEEIADLCMRGDHSLQVFWVEDFLDAIRGGMSQRAFRDTDVIIEMHHELSDAKRELLYALGNAAPPEALLLTSSLAVSATVAASWVKGPERVVGFGVLPPLGEKNVVELAQPLQASAAALQRAHDFWQSLGQETVVVADGSGLVRARVVCCIINEAVTALQEGVANAADIDLAMRLGTNYPYGPLAWADHLGVDTVYGVMSGLFEEWGSDRYRPAPLLRRMVVAGRLGKKSGQGFFSYDRSD